MGYSPRASSSSSRPCGDRQKGTIVTTPPSKPPVLASSAWNRGVAFSPDQRSTLGLTGRLPYGVLTLEEQAARSYAQLQQEPDDLHKNLFLEALHDRNETLYFKIISEHLAELLPIVYDPTVGDAIKQYSDEYQGPRGVYLSINHPDAIEQSFTNLGLGADDVDLIVCTDAEEILGIGDWGVNGMQISVGKLAIYSAGGGIDPRRVIPVSLDVGTDNELSCSTTRTTSATATRAAGAATTTPSSSATWKPRRSSSRKPSCTLRTSDPNMHETSS